MNFFLDTEFNQHGPHVELLSIGIVADDGREYYAQNREADFTTSNPFVTEHVLPLFDETSWKDSATIRDDVTHFVCGGTELPNIWTYFGNYDWVALCGTLYGDMTALPKGFPYTSFDIQQFAFHIGFRKIRVPKPALEHHALADARWTKDAYLWLKRQEAKKKGS